MFDVWVKICGIKIEVVFKVVCDVGVVYVGFVFFFKSLCNVFVVEVVVLVVEILIGVVKVVLVVDFDDVLLDEII